jgi:hypothetical protein
MRKGPGPFEDQVRQNRFGDLFDGAIRTIRGYEIEDRFGLYHRIGRPPIGDVVVELFSSRTLPRSRMEAGGFLKTYAPDEWERVTQRLAPSGYLVIAVLGPHPRGRTVSEEEENRIRAAVGLPPV